MCNKCWKFHGHNISSLVIKVWNRSQFYVPACPVFASPVTICMPVYIFHTTAAYPNTHHPSLLCQEDTDIQSCHQCYCKADLACMGELSTHWHLNKTQQIEYTAVKICYAVYWKVYKTGGYVRTYTSSAITIQCITTVTGTHKAAICVGTAVTTGFINITLINICRKN